MIRFSAKKSGLCNLLRARQLWRRDSGAEPEALKEWTARSDCTSDLESFEDRKSGIKRWIIFTAIYQPYCSSDLQMTSTDGCLCTVMLIAGAGGEIYFIPKMALQKGEGERIEKNQSFWGVMCLVRELIVFKHTDTRNLSACLCLLIHGWCTVKYCSCYQYPIIIMHCSTVSCYLRQVCSLLSDSNKDPDGWE